MKNKKYLLVGGQILEVIRKNYPYPETYTYVLHSNITLEDLLEEFSVLYPGAWKNEQSSLMKEWYAVANNSGIIAYFGREEDALSFRLHKINVELNHLNKISSSIKEFYGSDPIKNGMLDTIGREVVKEL
jgi:hypothetical protein